MVKLKKRITHCSACAICAALLVFACQQPPLQSLEYAKKELAGAADAGAVKYAESDYRKAERLVADGWMELSRQNGRLFILRNYKLADSLLKQGADMALTARKKAVDEIRFLDSSLTSDFKEIRSALDDWRSSLDGALVLYSAERYWTLAELAYSSGVQLLGQKEFEAARQEIIKIKVYIESIAREMADYAEDEARELAGWRNWVKETIAQSRASGKSAIIVDKNAHKLYLLKNGNIHKTFRCELGYNSSGQKYFAGDGATPEGRYRVTQIRHNGSIYYKALMLDYPNDADRKRFAKNKRQGIIAKNARIGGLIEIHGDGGRKRDWTNGCVALKNSDMDSLIPEVEAGTPVTIVRKSDRWP